MSTSSGPPGFLQPYASDVQISTVRNSDPSYGFTLSFKVEPHHEKPEWLRYISGQMETLDEYRDLHKAATDDKPSGVKPRVLIRIKLDLELTKPWEKTDPGQRRSKPTLESEWDQLEWDILHGRYDISPNDAYSLITDLKFTRRDPNLKRRNNVLGLTKIRARAKDESTPIEKLNIFKEFSDYKWFKEMKDVIEKSDQTGSEAHDALDKIFSELKRHGYRNIKPLYKEAEKLSDVMDQIDQFDQNFLKDNGNLVGGNTSGVLKTVQKARNVKGLEEKINFLRDAKEMVEKLVAQHEPHSIASTSKNDEINAELKILEPLDLHKNIDERWEEFLFEVNNGRYDLNLVQVETLTENIKKARDSGSTADQQEAMLREARDWARSKEVSTPMQKMNSMVELANQGWFKEISGRINEANATQAEDLLDEVFREKRRRVLKEKADVRSEIDEFGQNVIKNYDKMRRTVSLAVLSKIKEAREASEIERQKGLLQEAKDLLKKLSSSSSESSDPESELEKMGRETYGTIKDLSKRDGLNLMKKVKEARETKDKDKKKILTQEAIIPKERALNKISNRSARISDKSSSSSSESSDLEFQLEKMGRETYETIKDLSRRDGLNLLKKVKEARETKDKEKKKIILQEAIRFKERALNKITKRRTSKKAKISSSSGEFDEEDKEEKEKALNKISKSATKQAKLSSSSSSSDDVESELDKFGQEMYKSAKDFSGKEGLNILKKIKEARESEDKRKKKFLLEGAKRLKEKAEAKTTDLEKLEKEIEDFGRQLTQGQFRDKINRSDTSNILKKLKETREAKSLENKKRLWEDVKELTEESANKIDQGQDSQLSPKDNHLNSSSAPIPKPTPNSSSTPNSSATPNSSSTPSKMAEWEFPYSSFHNTHESNPSNDSQWDYYDQSSRGLSHSESEWEDPDMMSNLTLPSFPEDTSAYWLYDPDRDIYDQFLQPNENILTQLGTLTEEELIKFQKYSDELRRADREEFAEIIMHDRKWGDNPLEKHGNLMDMMKYTTDGLLENFLTQLKKRKIDEENARQANEARRLRQEERRRSQVRRPGYWETYGEIKAAMTPEEREYKRQQEEEIIRRERQYYQQLKVREDEERARRTPIALTREQLTGSTRRNRTPSTRGLTYGEIQALKSEEQRQSERQHRENMLRQMNQYFTRKREEEVRQAAEKARRMAQIDFRNKRNRRNSSTSHNVSKRSKITERSMSQGHFTPSYQRPSRAPLKRLGSTGPRPFRRGSTSFGRGKAPSRRYTWNDQREGLRSQPLRRSSAPSKFDTSRDEQISIPSHFEDDDDVFGDINVSPIRKIPEHGSQYSKSSTFNKAKPFHRGLTRTSTPIPQSFLSPGSPIKIDYNIEESSSDEFSSDEELY